MVTTASSNRLARLNVADQGPGIASEELPHIFEWFWRGRLAAGRAGAASGWRSSRSPSGLTVGRVQVRSAPGDGIRFTVLLPRS
jgi:signal transduction histidine kinase